MGPRRPLAAARPLAASSESRLTALLCKPTPWTVTSIVGESGRDGTTSPPLAGPTVNVHHSTADDNLLGLNGAPHRSPVDSAPPTYAQPAENKAPSLPWKWVEITQQQAAPAPLAAPLFRSHSPTAGAPALPEFSHAAAAAVPKNIPTTGIFIGNVPLHAHDSDFNSCDKFAASFNNSTRRTLSYVNPSIQNGEVIVRPSIDVVRAGSRRWDCTAVGYFLGRKPYYHHLNDYVRSVWPEVKEVTATSNGFYFFKFKTEVAMEEVIEGGPWLFQGQPIVLQRWEPGMVLRKHKHTQVPVWIRLRHLPVEFWTNEGLSTVASGVGRPLYQDTITRACTRLDFARVCVMLDISSTLPKHLVVMMPKENGSEIPCKVEVEYEWVPPKCKQCMSLGHSMATCPDSKKSEKSAVAVYIQKRPVQTPPKASQPNGEMAAVPPKLKMKEHVQAAPIPENIHPHTEVDRVSKEMPGNGRDKDGLSRGPNNCSPSDDTHVEYSDMECSGLNRRDHQVAVRDLVCEFRLHFIALLETRVLQSNVTRIQSGVLSRWRWFVDYAGPGNRIWIAWNDELIDVDILNVGTQFIHCRVLVHELHESIFTTVVYGANDVSTRRELWQELIDLAGTIGNVPWLVGGDFNAVLDMSEVSGASGDIRVATTEFNDCILQTGLLSLPMQGERFTWHNCSLDGRSLWKRLDRLLVNDVWMDRWPNLYYTCLTPRTSDHSPMVLKGDCRNMQVSLFRFDNYLALSPGFLASVQSIWRHPVVGTPMYSVTRKLKALKPVFRQQRRSKGDLAMNVNWRLVSWRSLRTFSSWIGTTHFFCFWSTAAGLFTSKLLSLNRLCCDRERSCNG
ncbi:UNVERIFIED_CONTAM: hypothetical protein Sangu_2637400 [Sesamum angustifolium]|uniref:DUF4283 domain-containing protein n=1 Tax=Sesamum angustifolium TaxID=2727405 RepID=A0AAW2J3D3_9LAMI